jgi:hypothetical protein
VVAEKAVNEAGRTGSGLSVLDDSELSTAFGVRAREVFGSHGKSQRLAEAEAIRLWLAWRGDQSYLVVHLGSRAVREGSWRVVRYTEIPGLSEEHNFIEARGFGRDLPEYVLARFIQFFVREVNRVPGARVTAEGIEESPGPVHVGHEIADEAYGYLKAGKVLTARWPGNGAPGLYARILVLSKDAVQDSRYPALAEVMGSHRESDRGFTKFLERAEAKRQKSWVKWVTHG